jgi:hypothetical protein
MAGYIRTEEHKRKVSETIRKYFSDPENRKKHTKGQLFQKDHTPWNVGIHSNHGGGSKKGSIPWNKGKKTGQKVWNKGTKGLYSEEYKQKIGIAHSGAKSVFWKGGISRGDNKQEYYHIKTLERLARKKNAEGSHTVEEWLALKGKYNNSCAICFVSDLESKLTIDHIIPLKLGGTHYISNIQPLCRSCNSRKGAKPQP